MSAAQPKSAEPSMEEILASIRRIIADEPVKPATPPAPANTADAAPAAPAPKPAPVAAADDDVMELTPKPKVKAPEPHLINDDPVDNDLSFAEPVEPKQLAPAPAEMPAPSMAPVQVMPEIPAVTAPALQPSERAPALPPAERLISPDTDRAASSAFSSLTNTILTRNARTLDDLMQEMMRPMVKQWLDDNLPAVVERLVRAEIERVSRGGR